MDIINLTVEKGEEKQRIDKFLATRLFPITRTRIQTLIDDNQLSCGPAIITSASHKIAEGEAYTLTIPPATEATPKAEEIPLSILYEDSDLLVLNKPAGMVVHPAPGHHHSTLVNALLNHCGESLSGIGGVRRPGIVHRLDKDTSGLMVVAKNDIAHQGLCAQFANRTLSRSYWAFVWGMPSVKEDVVETQMGRSSKNRQKMAVVPQGGKLAITHYRVLKTFFAKNHPSQSISLIQCDLKTGRTHQIRVHLSHIGHSLIGDPLYGHTPKQARKAFLSDVVSFPRQALHAFCLKFIHPKTQVPLTFEAPLPSDLESLLSHL